MHLKKRIVFIVVFLFALSGCAALDKMAGLPVNEGNGYTIDHDRNIYGGGVHIEYRDQEFLKEEVRKQMENRMASEADLQLALDQVPAGGRILVHYQATTVEAANTKWLEYVVLKDGEQIYRKQGTNQTGEVPTSYSGGIGFWWNMDVVDLKGQIGTPFELAVISNLRDERDIFRVSKP